jgi:flagellar hook assembly protein FlgD
MIWNTNYADEIVYPNPFSKETKIEFEVMNSERIHIVIYNQNGQLIKDIINGDYLANGKFQVMWDGTDNSGNAVADGVYVYKIFKGKGPSQAGKIILKR